MLENPTGAGSFIKDAAAALADLEPPEGQPLRIVWAMILKAQIDMQAFAATAAARNQPVQPPAAAASPSVEEKGEELSRKPLTISPALKPSAPEPPAANQLIIYGRPLEFAIPPAIPPAILPARAGSPAIQVPAALRNAACHRIASCAAVREGSHAAIAALGAAAEAAGVSLHMDAASPQPQFAPALRSHTQISALAHNMVMADLHLAKPGALLLQLPAEELLALSEELDTTC